MSKKLETKIFHMPGEYSCPVCGRFVRIQKAIRKYFEAEGAAGIECPECGTVKYWYKIPDPREPKSKRAAQNYYNPEDYE